MREQYLRQGDVFLLVYDVTDTTSFHKIPTFREQILTVKGWTAANATTAAASGAGGASNGTADGPGAGAR